MINFLRLGDEAVRPAAPLADPPAVGQWTPRPRESGIAFRPTPAVLSPADTLPYGLTTREWEVAQLLAAGASNSAIAQRLAISPNTARNHTQSVLQKVGALGRRTQVADRLREAGS